MFDPRGPTFWELARQALSSTERGYDLLASKFDYTPFRTPDALLREVVSHLGSAGSIDRALDVCCGTGAAMQFLRPLCRRSIAGLDRSRGMLRIARENLTAAPSPSANPDSMSSRDLEGARSSQPEVEGPRKFDERPVVGRAEVQLIRGDVLQIPLAAEFDLAVCFGALGHILPCDEDRFIRQVANTLKPGGRFVFVTTFLPPRWSAGYWLSRGFNAAMHVRNFLIRPPFIMYYLTFLLPGCAARLRQSGWEVQILPPETLKIDPRLRLVIATKTETTDCDR